MKYIRLFDNIYNIHPNDGVIALPENYEKVFKFNSYTFIWIEDINDLNNLKSLNEFFVDQTPLYEYIKILMNIYFLDDGIYLNRYYRDIDFYIRRFYGETDTHIVDKRIINCCYAFARTMKKSEKLDLKKINNSLSNFIDYYIENNIDKYKNNYRKKIKK